jgi:hypothetical protein
MSWSGPPQGLILAPECPVTQAVCQASVAARVQSVGRNCRDQSPLISTTHCVSDQGW